MIALMFLFGLVFLFFWSMGTGVIAGLSMGLIHRTMSKKKRHWLRITWPFMVNGVIGSMIGSIYGIVHGVQKHLATCQEYGPNCQFEAAGIGFMVGLFSAFIGAVTSVLIWGVISVYWQKINRTPSP